jgi:hypothetical protein
MTTMQRPSRITRVRTSKRTSFVGGTEGVCDIEADGSAVARNG